MTARWSTKPTWSWSAPASRASPRRGRWMRPVRGVRRARSARPGRRPHGQRGDRRRQGGRDGRPVGRPDPGPDRRARSASRGRDLPDPHRRARTCSASTAACGATAARSRGSARSRCSTSGAACASSTGSRRGSIPRRRGRRADAAAPRRDQLRDLDRPHDAHRDREAADAGRRRERSGAPSRRSSRCCTWPSTCARPGASSCSPTSRAAPSRTVSSAARRPSRSRSPHELGDAGRARARRCGGIEHGADGVRVEAGAARRAGAARDRRDPAGARRPDRLRPAPPCPHEPSSAGG